jgi:tagatose 1,6-diphosphate aldolase
MEKVRVSAGKLRGLKRIADEEGRFRMMAIDQRGSLKKALSRILSREVAYGDLAAIKRAIVKVLSPYSSATLIDPVYGYPEALKYFPKDVGLLITLEETGAEKVGSSGQERKSRLIAGWDIGKTRRLGADAAKLLIYYRGDASPDVVEHQRRIIREVGEDCVKDDIPYVLELVGYPFQEDEETYAKQKPGIVFDYVEEFSKPEYNVDLLKVEFPANLKYCREFADGEFDGQRREPVYGLSEVEGFCRRVTELSRVPWVILSAGVDIDEFVENVCIATENGASGFLGGRAIWQDCVNYYPDIEAVEQWLSSSGLSNFQRLYTASQDATPYFEASPFQGYPRIELDKLGEGWYRDY